MSDPYADEQDVRNALGTLAARLPSFVSLASNLSVAHAQVVDRLGQVYPNGIPTWAGDALDVVRFVEAKIAAAETLEQIRMNLPDLGDQPDRLRASAWASIDDGVVGYPPGSSDAGSGGGTPSTSVPGPRMSSFTPLSAFSDPYAAARDTSRFQ